MPRPQIYYTKDSISKPLLAKTGEFIFQDTLKQYTGIYVLANGQYLTGPRPSKTSKIIIPVTQKFSAEKTSKYFELTGLEFNKHTTPSQYYAKPTSDEYKVGQFQRYFVQKINEPERIYEINKEQFTTVNKDNKVGINGRLYKKFKIQWMLSGEDANTINIKNIDFASINHPGISRYLSNTAQFIL